MQNAFQMERLREQVQQVRLLDVISSRTQGDEIASQSCWIAGNVGQSRRPKPYQVSNYFVSQPSPRGINHDEVGGRLCTCPSQVRLDGCCNRLCVLGKIRRQV